MPPAPPTAPALDAARERVVRLLTDRYADDTLTVEQFEVELDRLHALTDAGALERMGDALTSGARPAVTRTATRAVAAPADWSSAALGWQRGVLVSARVPEVGRVVAIMSQSRRQGPWAVPRSLRVRAVMSEAVVDLRDAVLPAEGCAIDVAALMANVKVLLPAGVEAAVAVTALMGAALDHTHAGPTAGAAPRVRVTGASVMAEVRVLQGVEADLAALGLDD